MHDKITSDITVNNITYDEAIEYNQQSFTAFNAENSDFNGPIFFSCHFDGCHFKKSNLSSSRFFTACSFYNCTFEKCDMRAIGIGEDGSKFVKTTFKDCDFRGTALDRAHWVDCSFERCNLRDLTLHASNWINCRFTGVLREIHFTGKGEPLLIDFENCKLDCVSFEHCTLTECVPPNQKFHHYVDFLKEKIERASLLLQTVDEPTRKIVTRRLKSYASMNEYIFNKKSLTEIEGVVVADILARIFSLGDS
ncbi:pentapeptide repeat-containing protein [Ottowia thiooxydans]|uniref:pentapeptide repeat-containing protein n=1 Tax=Ottowia thiooxydans TaxID=219182 RepID=UPI00055BDBF6|nr:pentapeptide repeat-containing protein [Ottowia thiooxydans]